LQKISAEIFVKNEYNGKYRNKLIKK